MNNKNIIMIPYANVEELNTGVNLQDYQNRVSVYLKNCCVACISAKQHNSDSDVALVTNIEVPDPYASILEKNGIIIIHISFDSFTFGGNYTWALAFYKLCVLYHVSHELDYNKLAYLDSDVYIQSDFKNIWKECDDKILLYDIEHGLQVEAYNRFHKEVMEFLTLNGKLSRFPKYPIQYGGEFFVANRENAIKFSEKCKEVYESMLAVDYRTTQGDEFILSIVANILQPNVKNAGAYCFRFWTGSLWLISTRYKVNPVVVLHVPSEKEDGMLKIYDKYISKGKVISDYRAIKLLHLNCTRFHSLFSKAIKKMQIKLGRG